MILIVNLGLYVIDVLKLVIPNNEKTLSVEVMFVSISSSLTFIYYCTCYKKYEITFFFQYHVFH